MKRTFCAAAIAVLATAAVLPAVAETLPDFTDKDTYTCDQAMIESELGSLIENSTAGHFGMRLLYVKDIAETVRKPNELRCKVTAVTNKSSQVGIFRLINQDGHTLSGFQPGRVK